MSVYKYLPKIEYAIEYLIHGKLQFQNTALKYPDEFPIVSNSDLGIGRTKKLFASCFTYTGGNDQDYFWCKYGGKGDGVRIEFFENIFSNGASKEFEVDGRIIGGTVCTYRDIPQKEWEELRFFSEDEIQENFPKFTYSVPKKPDQSIESEFRLFVVDRSEKNEIFIRVNDRLRFFPTKLEFGKSVRIESINAAIEKLQENSSIGIASLSTNCFVLNLWSKKSGLSTA